MNMYDKIAEDAHLSPGCQQSLRRRCRATWKPRTRDTYPHGRQPQLDLCADKILSRLRVPRFVDASSKTEQTRAYRQPPTDQQRKPVSSGDAEDRRYSRVLEVPIVVGGGGERNSGGMVAQVSQVDRGVRHLRCRGKVRGAGSAT